MRLLAACLILALALPASAQIYKYTDAKGNTVFTDQPPEGVQSETLDLPPANTVQMQPPSPIAKDREQDRQTAQAPYRVLRLINLPSEEALRANNGTFSVDVELQPQLRSGHSLRLLLDGKPYGTPSTVPRLQVVNVDRGEHSLAVEVLSGDTSLQQSETHTFTVQRVHTGSPALRPQPQPRPSPAP
ncbi:DUF4124 domain-containing protein [Zestomonas carbonaria]|uniref:DUF4124 domain-containing protein n=1 Tax=Zestomonas carbonaria TaxID=2762745 RepID=A0A7U7ICF6_9GAMM|nr:DUF4124 domain-containing protein [Pseudomonas carbonaria]CAD5110502.1 hypothetical protein PSEWESI4_04825 [Pseudomonas carbonaria]